MGLVDDLESRRFHPQEILPTELPIMAHLPDFETTLSHVLKPSNHVRVVYSRRVTQRQPPVFCPAEQGNIVLIRLEVGRHHREKSVGDDNIRPLVAAKQGRRR